MADAIRMSWQEQGYPAFIPPTPCYMKYLAEHINMLTGSDIGYMTCR